MIKVGHELSDEEIAQRYTMSASKITMPDYFYAEVAQFIKQTPGYTLLDIGCGHGGLLAQVIKHRSVGRFLGTEISQGRLHLAQVATNYRVLLIHQDAKGYLPLRDETVDIVLLTEVIEHVKDPLQFLYDIRRIL